MTRVNVERWRAHVKALSESGLNVAQYAEKHGLSRHTMYAARRQIAEVAKRMPQSKRTTIARAAQGAFVAVRVLSTPLALRAELGNGVRLEFAQLETDACAKVITMLAGLPCSN